MITIIIIIIINVVNNLDTQHLFEMPQNIYLAQRVAHVFDGNARRMNHTPRLMILMLSGDELATTKNKHDYNLIVPWHMREMKLSSHELTNRRIIIIQCHQG